jgi:hypothetical protein
LGSLDFHRKAGLAFRVPPGSLGQLKTRYTAPTSVLRLLSLHTLVGADSFLNLDLFSAVPLL